MHKPSEHDFWHNRLKFYDKIDLPNRMRIIYSVKHRHAIRLKFGNTFLTSLNDLGLEVKVNFLQSEKIYFYIVVSFPHLLSLLQFNIFK